ncbi:uncharacterized protein LOC111087225 [Limulus polyphemus]|uniref:Uncharacterized protein LOC111087225 n=1 Tax=Limulus polyphemus TaxID=6850 RepID=A0ABM1SZ14_LIMPO|nr:uncharacterized protein LOC111087225 [Limulus polyphemus]XP_022248870.1 uncharacterized protein LOC111087225 [Limulus polyphemus]
MAAVQPVSDPYWELERYLEQAQEEIGRAFEDLELCEGSSEKKNSKNKVPEKESICEVSDIPFTKILTPEVDGADGYRKWGRKLSCPSSPEYPYRSPELSCTLEEKHNFHPSICTRILSGDDNDDVFYPEVEKFHLSKKYSSLELTDLNERGRSSNNLYQCERITGNNRLEHISPNTQSRLLTVPARKQQQIIPSPPTTDSVEVLSVWANNLVKEIDETFSSSDHDYNSAILSSPSGLFGTKYDSLNCNTEKEHGISLNSNEKCITKPWYSISKNNDVCKYSVKYNFRNKCLGKPRVTRQLSYPASLGRNGVSQSFFSFSRTRRLSCPSCESSCSKNTFCMDNMSSDFHGEKLKCETAVQTNDDDYFVHRSTDGEMVQCNHSSLKMRAEIGVQTCPESKESPNEFSPTPDRNIRLETDSKHLVESVCAKEILDRERQTNISSKNSEVDGKSTTINSEVDGKSTTINNEVDGKSTTIQPVTEGDIDNPYRVNNQKKTNFQLKTSPGPNDHVIFCDMKQTTTDYNKTGVSNKLVGSSPWNFFIAMGRNDNSNVSTIKNWTVQKEQRSKSDSDISGKVVFEWNVPSHPKEGTKSIANKTVIPFHKDGCLFCRINIKSSSCPEMKNAREIPIYRSKNHTNELELDLTNDETR